MPDLIDYYTVLGVPSTASAGEIRKAKQRMAMLYHPDRNKSPAANQMMALVNTAATVLLDPGKRSVYDAQLAGEEATSASAGMHATAAATSPESSSQQARTHRDPARGNHATSERRPQEPARNTSSASGPSVLARALGSSLMSLVTVLSWAIGIALGVAGLVLASGIEGLWLKLLVLVLLVGIGFAFPSAAIAAMRRLLHGRRPGADRETSV